VFRQSFCDDGEHQPGNSILNGYVQIFASLAFERAQLEDFCGQRLYGLIEFSFVFIHQSLPS